MREAIMKHFTETSLYTFAGPYADYFKTLPTDVKALGNLVCGQVIHPITLHQCDPNMFPLYGDLREFPKYRMVNEDDVFQTAVAMTAELFRLDSRGFTSTRRVEDKLVVTCRYVSVLMSSVLKSQGIPCRSRAGFFNYWPDTPSTSDHWINEYWDESLKRWVAFDADGFYPFDELLGFSQYDIPKQRFAWAPDIWLGIRRGELDGDYYNYADSLGTKGMAAAVRQLFYDFHAIMNNEVSYNCLPSFIYKTERFLNLTEEDLQKIDQLAQLMLDPDSNFEALLEIWLTTDKYRILCSPLIEDIENL